MRILLADDAALLREADWLLEIGPGSGREGGEIVVSAPMADVVADPASRIAVHHR